MKNFINRFKYFILGGLVFAGIGVYAATIQPTFTGSHLPLTTSTYYLGTTTPSTNAWKGLIVDQICLTADSCRTSWPSGGGSGGDPDVLYLTLSGTRFYVASTSATDNLTWFFKNGFISNASSTFASTLFIPALSQGLLYTGTNSKVNSTATSSLAIGASLSNSGTLGAQIGGTASSLSINTANANTWSVLQTFNYSSSTVYSSFLTSSSTNLFAGLFTLSTTTAGCTAISATGQVYSTGTACGTSSGLTSYDPFTHPTYGGSATTSLVTFNTGGILVTASSTFSNHSATTTFASNVLISPSADASYGFNAWNEFNIVDTVNNPMQMNVVNKSNGTLAGSGIFVGNRKSTNSGFTSVYYGGIFMAGSDFAVYPGLQPDNLVLVNSDSNLRLAALSSNLASSTMTFSVGPGFTTSNYDMSLIPTTGGVGFLGISTTTPQYPLTVFSTTTSQISLANEQNISQWVLRNAGAQFYLATTTSTGSATSTASVFRLDTNGFPYFTSLSAASSNNCLQVDTTGKITNTGSTCGAGGGLSSYDAFTHVSVYGQTTSASSTLLALTGSPFSLVASSTVNFVNASTTLLSLKGASDGCAQFSTNGLLSSTGSACGSSTGLTSYDAFTHPSAWQSATTSNMIFGTTTASNFTLTLASTTNPQLALSSGGGFSQWYQRNAGGTFYLGTTTVAGTATSTTPILTIDPNGNSTLTSSIISLTGGKTTISNFLGVGTTNGGSAAIEAKSLTSGSIQGLRIENDTHGNVAFSTFVTGDAQLRFSFLDDGIMKWSTGAATADTQLSRTAVGQLSLVGLNAGSNGASLTIGTSTSTISPLTIASTTQPQIALSSGGGFSQWTFRNSSGTFYVATTSTAGTATSSTASISIGTDNIVRFGNNNQTCIALTGSSALCDGSDDGAGGGSGIADPFTHPLLGLSATTSQMLIGTSTASNYQLTISSSTAPQLSLSAGGGLQQFTFRNAGGNFYLSTTSVAGTATTSIPIWTVAMNSATSKATTTIAGGLAVDNSAFEYDYGSGITSIDNANLGGMSFDNDAGIVSWIDLPVSTTTTGADESYSAMLDGTPYLTMYGRTDGAGGLKNMGVAMGTTSASAMAVLTIASTTQPQLSLSGGQNIVQWTFRNAGGSLFIATTTADGTATSTNSAIAINTNGNIFLKELSQSGSNQTYYACGVATTFELVWDTTTCLVSARKFKEDIKPIDVGLNELLKLQPVNYFLKNKVGGINNEVQQFGFIADDAEKIDSRLVTYDGNGDIHGFRYEQYTAVMTKAIQELNAKVDNIGGGVKKSIQDFWQWIVMAFMFAWIIKLQIDIKKK